MKISGLLILILISGVVFGQKDKAPMYFGNTVIIDSTSSLVIPILYNEDLLSTNKIALWNDYYANIIFYDFKSDSARRLFPKNTFIARFNTDLSYYRMDTKPKLDNVSSQWVFYFVRPIDYNNSGRVDSEDPAILYVSDKSGRNLKALTPENENAVGIAIFDKEGFALIKMQRDSNGNRDFQYKDRDFYYCRLDLNTLELGRKIELNGY